MNEPPDHTAVFSAANLLSPTGITEPKYSWNSSSCSRSAGVGVEEDDALLLQVLADLVVDDLGLVLRRDAGDQPLLLGLRDAEPVVGVLDVRRAARPRRSACFSVDRTKYLMLSKSMPDRSEPQVGIGFLPNSRRPLSRRSSIHSGSFFSAEMSRTTSSDSPRCAAAPAASESAQPNS